MPPLFATHYFSILSGRQPLMQITIVAPRLYIWGGFAYIFAEMISFSFIGALRYIR